MAYMKQAKTEDEVKRLTLSGLKKAYNDLATDYNKIIEEDVILCHKCNNFISRSNYYTSNEYKTGVFPICKKCLLEMVEQRNGKNDKPNETKDSVKRVLQLMNLPFIEELYDAQCKVVADEVNEKNRKSPFLAYLVPLKSLPQYNNLTWRDTQYSDNSDYDDEVEFKENKKTIKAAKKRFGLGYTNEEYMFLENEYQDWVSRYECNTKAQESLFERLSFKKLEIMKATKNGQPTKDLDRTYTDLLSSANLLPRQNVDNASTDQLTFGQLLDKWENEEPLPEPDEDFKDIDKIGLLIDVFFKGHLAKMMGLKNGFSAIYENFMKKYTVNKPQYEEDTDSEILFEQIFGSRIDE